MKHLKKYDSIFEHTKSLSDIKIGDWIIDDDNEIGLIIDTTIADPHHYTRHSKSYTLYTIDYFNPKFYTEITMK